MGFGFIAVRRFGYSQFLLQRRQSNATFQYIDKYRSSANVLIPSWPRKLSGRQPLDTSNKCDSWSGLYDPVGRVLMHCSYNHVDRLQIWTWDESVMQALEFSKDDVLDLMNEVPPFYPFVLEYGDATLDRDKDASTSWEREDPKRKRMSESSV